MRRFGCTPWAACFGGQGLTTKCGPDAGPRGPRVALVNALSSGPRCLLLHEERVPCTWSVHTASAHELSGQRPHAVTALQARARRRLAGACMTRHGRAEVPRHVAGLHRSGVHQPRDGAAPRPSGDSRRGVAVRGKPGRLGEAGSPSLSHGSLLHQRRSVARSSSVPVQNEVRAPGPEQVRGSRRPPSSPSTPPAQAARPLIWKKKDQSLR